MSGVFSKPSVRQFLIQRRLPGAQGVNGCWQDVTVIDATSADEAIDAWQSGANFSGEHRVAELPRWETFNLRIGYTSQKVVNRV